MVYNLNKYRRLEVTLQTIRTTSQTERIILFIILNTVPSVIKEASSALRKEVQKWLQIVRCHPMISHSSWNQQLPLLRSLLPRKVITTLFWNQAPKVFIVINIIRATLSKTRSIQVWKLHSSTAKSRVKYLRRKQGTYQVSNNSSSSSRKRLWRPIINRRIYMKNIRLCNLTIFKLTQVGHL